MLAWLAFNPCSTSAQIAGADQTISFGQPVQATQGDGAAVGVSDAQLRMLDMMLNRVRERPDHSESWRSLARLQSAVGEKAVALASVRRALELDDFNAAAHFDLGQLLMDQSRQREARLHFDRVFEIAPKSSYAGKLSEQGIERSREPLARLGMPQTGMPPSTKAALPSASLPAAEISGGIPVQPASYEIQSFDGSDDLEQRFVELESEAVRPGGRLRVFLESGLLYNDNVTLTPVSRELAQAESASFQGFVNPDIDFKLLRTPSSRAGVLFRGYFTVNEEAFESFNLASYQPGGFAERDFRIGGSEAIGRLDYVFSNDFFDGDQVGDRHAVTASLTVIRPDLDAFYGYLTIAESDFVDDGADPDQTSLDGTTISVGLSRFFQSGWNACPTYSLGIDGQIADTLGADYRYDSVNLHGSTEWKLSDRWALIPTFGIGLRIYDDFTGEVSRDEFFWRGHGRLRYTFSDAWSVSLVAGHDRFASDNEDFDTQRSEGGLVVTYAR